SICRQDAAQHTCVSRRSAHDAARGSMAGRTAPRVRTRRESGGMLVRAALVGVAGPALATAVALLIPHAGATSAASLYILAVAAAAAVGRLPGGLVAAATGVPGLDFFFTPPRHP